MGRDDEFGPDTETIRAWLDKRATYAKDARLSTAPAPAPPPVTPTSTPAPEPPAPAAPAGPDTRVAGRSVVEALRTPEPAPEPAPTPEPVAPAVAPAVRATASEPAKGVRVSTPVPRASYQASSREAPATAAPAPVVRRGRWTEPEANRLALEATTDVDFPVRGGARRALSLVLVASLAATGVTAYVAAQDRAPTTIGIAGVLGFLTLVVWAVRAGCTTTQLSLRRGQLTIRRAGHTELVDIGSHHTPIAIVGEPGHRRWTVLLERPGLPLVVINASMVDPHWFTSALYRLRPELRPGHDDVSRG
ncbi:hypothetical protein [Nocardioides sp. LML1-1-1.1]|uniref:hypothetical protein n=1 Tax=Nocardioides sp. LML1-1-1.1 TaxID=3135248 RepID=UPI00342B53D8